jgi:hypothetical protein
VGQACGSAIGKNVSAVWRLHKSRVKKEKKEEWRPRRSRFEALIEFFVPLCLELEFEENRITASLVATRFARCLVAIRATVLGVHNLQTM